MGISIHFKGTIEAEWIDPLCAELADIATSAGLQESVPVDDDEKGLRGIILRPASEMESIPFLFDSEGRMHALGDLITGWDDFPILSVAVKTQFADIKDHIWLLELLRYIKRTYFQSLEVVGEGGYWESGDAVELKRRTEELGSMIEGFGAALENAFMDTAVEKNNPNALADFIEQVAKDFQRRDEGSSK